MIGALALLLAAVPAEQATCVFDTAAPEPCVVSFSVGKGGVTTLRARGKSGHSAVFVGKRGAGWWSGTFDGAPAMGYELNRGNVIFSVRTLNRSFQYWMRGHEHGNY